ncbi:hypothetical protein [Paenibacillus sp. ISL-20]|nr:hypothetical protein [Paenibacillus sp. ISL-20]MBT2764029.1 hypothetical protein [Paenibacillus sp. ISL-20]
MEPSDGTSYKVLFMAYKKCSNGAGGIVLEKRKWSPLPPDFNDVIS